MKIAKTIREFNCLIDNFKKESQKKISFVPTMGNLHQGHLELVKHARELADIVVISIFVNPLQFGDDEDLEKYPKTIDKDIENLKKYKADILLLPNSKDLYPDGLPSTQINNSKFSKIHCGKSRPGHFQGVCTVVNILFNIIKPDLALFGKKDYQQFLIIKKMAKDLHMPIKIIGIDTVRHQDGLALSSRNQYLNYEQRKNAPLLFEKLNFLKKTICLGSTNYSDIFIQVINELKHYDFDFEYLHLCNIFDLSIIEDGSDFKNSILIAATKLGDTRLIDNLIVNQ